MYPYVLRDVIVTVYNFRHFCLAVSTSHITDDMYLKCKAVIRTVSARFGPLQQAAFQGK